MRNKTKMHRSFVCIFYRCISLIFRWSILASLIFVRRPFYSI